MLFFTLVLRVSKRKHDKYGFIVCVCSVASIYCCSVENGNKIDGKWWLPLNDISITYGCNVSILHQTQLREGKRNANKRINDNQLMFGSAIRFL